jgi:hypothetical protein
VDHPSSCERHTIVALKLKDLGPALLAVLPRGLLVVDLVSLNFVCIAPLLHLTCARILGIKSWIVGEYQGQKLGSSLQGHSNNVAVGVYDASDFSNFSALLQLIRLV